MGAMRMSSSAGRAGRLMERDRERSGWRDREGSSGDRAEGWRLDSCRVCVCIYVRMVVELAVCGWMDAAAIVTAERNGKGKAKESGRRSRLGGSPGGEKKSREA